MLAGISADYYLRLERGRDRNPSLQVLSSIARALRLNEEHLAHLQALAAERPRHPRQRPREEPPSGLLALLGTLSQPAFIEDRHFDIVASNAAARALSPRLTAGGNQLRDVFLDPHERALHPDWENVTKCLVSSLRQAVGNAIDDPRLAGLVAQLYSDSPRFRQLWARHDVRRQYGATLRIDHPQVGDMTLNRERLAVSGTKDMALVVLHAEPASVDSERLARLATE